jgi:glycosyltransferase involved in cell wall biosynthesis
MLHQGAELYGSDKMFFIGATNLHDKGVDVVVVLSCDGPLVEMLRARGIFVKVLDLAVLRRSCLSGVFASFKWMWSFIRAVAALFYLVKEMKPDVVYVNTLAVVSPLCLKVLPFGKNIKYIHHIHEIQSAPKIIVKLLYKASIRFSDLVLCVSEAVREHVLQFDQSGIGKEKVKLLYNGIPPIEISDVRKEAFLNEFKKDGTFTGGESIVAIVGRLHSWKGQLEILDVIYSVSKIMPTGVKFVFFGDVFPGYECYKNEVYRKVEALGLSAVVKFCGERRDADILFDVCDLVLLPSIAPDPLPTVVLEAMSAGKPVIAYNMGGAQEMIVNGITGFLIPINDSLGFAEKIVALLSDKAASLEMGAKARLKFTCDFNLEAYSKNLHQFILLNTADIKYVL